jgi:hypothetical protein
MNIVESVTSNIKIIIAAIKIAGVKKIAKLLQDLKQVSLLASMQLLLVSFN